MRRLLRSTGLALGLPVLVAFASSCADSRATAPSGMAAAPGRVSNAVGGKLVISQIYGGGGNSGATLTNDFIELFNPGDAPITFSNWSVQYASAAGTSWQVTPISGTVPAGGYFLVQEAAGTGGTQPLPTPNASGGIPMSGTAGKVALRTSITPLSGACPTADAAQVVGFGTTASCGTSANLSNTTALLRANQGCGDTFAVGAPAPRNSSTPVFSCQPQPEVQTVTIDPTSVTLLIGGTKQFTAAAFDAANAPVSAAFTWTLTPSGIATVSASGLVTATSVGDVVLKVATGNGTFATATIHVDEPPLPDLPATRFSEIHYDNVGTDAGEFIEIEGPAGTDLTGWSVVLYTGSNGTSYDVRPLAGSIPATCGARGVIVVAFEQDGIQNGGSAETPDEDGVALIDADGNVVEFISYEGSFTATNGPALDKVSTNIGVSQSSAAHFQTLQRRPSGVWEGPKASTRGGCYGSTPVTPTNLISFTGRLPGDAPLPVGFEDQLFGTLRSPANATLQTTFTWTSLSPAIATIDADGVMHALAAGDATFRATAEDGTIATFTLPMAVATASTTAQYATHAEFGEPTDADASDDFILRRTEYTSSFNKTTNIPNWVAYNLDATHIVSGQDRCDCFTYDPLLPAEFTRYTTADYTGAGAAAGFGIDRGHLARSFDRTSGALDNARTFYFSNIIPQAAENNQGPWANFENYLGNLAASQNKELFIIAGASGNQGTIKNEGRIVIPSQVWKVAVILPRDQGLANVDSWDDVEVIAVILPNVTGIRNVPWETYKTTVDAVEALSGYDLLALLPDQVEIAVESNTKPPVASVNGPFTINEGGSVSLAGTGTDPDGDALTYAWSFGDGATGTGSAATHTYAQNGSYTATLTVTDIRGLYATASTTVTVDNVAPSIESFSVPAAVTSGQSVSATGTFTDPGPDAPWAFSFTWGEPSATTGSLGSTAIIATGSHTYFTAGTYTIRFTVTDKDGGVAFEERQVTVNRLLVASDVNPNRVNLNNNGTGRVIVRVLSSASFDATTISVASARIGSVAPVSSSTDDVNGDGRADLLLHFERDALISGGVLSSATTQLVLRADLADGRQLESRAAVVVR